LVVCVCLALLPVVFEAFENRLVARFVGFLFIQDNDVNAAQSVPVQAKRFSHDSLDTVSSRGQAAVFLRYRQSQSCSAEVCFSV